jgi:transportin-3
MSSSTFHSAGEQQLPPHSDNVDEELRRIQLALDAVFSTTATQPGTHHQWWEQRQLADRYLTSFQTTSVSWMVCDRLLLQEGGDPATAASSAGSSVIQQRQQQQQRWFFAAQTLHTKCRNDMHELPPQAVPSLRDSLIQHLCRIDDPLLSLRLGMCISALAVHAKWTTIVTDLLENCSSGGGNPAENARPAGRLALTADPNTCRRVAMAVLQTLPEECASSRLLLVDENSRYEMRDHLVSSAPLTFSFLLASMQDASHWVLQIFHIWIRYVPVHPQALADSPLLPACIQAMTRPEYLELAADVLVEVLRMYPSHHYANETLVQTMIPALSQLPLDEALRSDDEDVLRAYCRVVTEMGESYMSLILYSNPQQQQRGHNQHRQEASQLVSWILRCSEIDDTEISGITLHFWYRMVMDLEGVEPFDWRQELTDTYATHLLQLVQVCVTNLMKFPPDIDDIADDLVEDLQKHRGAVAETIEDCCRLLGGHSVLLQLDRLLKEDVNRVSGRVHSDWQGLESCLSCIGAVHRFVPGDESTVLPFCFGLVPQLPADIKPLRYTASTLIGRYASWLALHPELLQPLLPYLAQGLSVPECAAAAAVAIKELCGCSNQSFSIAEPVLQLYEQFTLDPGRLSVQDGLHILEGVCLALSRTIQDTHDDGKQFLSRLARPIGSRLAATVADASSSPRRIIPDLDRLTAIVQHLKVPYIPTSSHPMVDLMQSVWPLLEAATSRFPSDAIVAEKICRLHKHTMRACGSNAYAPMLGALMAQLVTSFEKTHQSPFLYAASICITEYGHDPAFSSRLYDMVFALSKTSFSFLRSLEELTNHPDVVEEFFYLMGRMISYCPDPIVTSPLLQPLAQCAVVGMELYHPGANKGTLKFLENTISHGLQLREQNKPESQSSLERVLTQEGQGIASNLARAMTGDLPSYSNQVPEIMWKFNLLCPGLLSQWLSSAFASTSNVPERAEAEFMNALDIGLARDEFSLVVRAFQTACDRERRFKKIPRCP